MEDARVEEIFERISNIDIELDYDPIERGPKHLNQMVARCRNYTTEVQKYMRECQMHIRQVERELLRAKADFELQFNHLMANDPEIIQMRGLSRADREALANTKLQEEVVNINGLDQALTDAKHVETVIDSKLRELRDVNRDIRLQKQLIQSEIETGAMWGNDLEGQNSGHFDSGDVDVDVEDMFENPDSASETEGSASTADYEDMFVFDSKNKSVKTDVETIDTEKYSINMDSGSGETDDRPDPRMKESDTSIFEEEEVFDFDSALRNLG